MPVIAPRSAVSNHATSLWRLMMVLASMHIQQYTSYENVQRPSLTNRCHDTVPWSNSMKSWLTMILILVVVVVMLAAAGVSCGEPARQAQRSQQQRSADTEPSRAACLGLWCET